MNRRSWATARIYSRGGSFMFAKFALTISSIALLLTLGAASSTTSNTPSSWTIDQWVAWRDTEISEIFVPATDSHGNKILNRKAVITACATAYKTIKQCTDSDPNYFISDPQRSKALGNFVQFVTAQQWMGIQEPVGGVPKYTHTLGMPVTDLQYWNIASPYVGFPDLIKSQKFLAFMSNPKTYKDAIDMINSQNQNLPAEQQWKTLFFQAQFITTVDPAHTYGRLLIYIPNVAVGQSGTADQWVLFGVATPGTLASVPMQSVSMFTIYRGASNPDYTTTYFSDFLRTQDPQSGNYSIMSNFTLPNDPSHNCYQCHKSSALPIHPAIEYDFDANKALVPKTVGIGNVADFVNGRIMGYGQPNFTPQDTRGYGPCLGPSSHARSDEFIKSATQGINLPLASYDHVRNAMICSSCHDSFATINYPQAICTDLDAGAFVGGKSMVQTYVEQGYMPPGSSLTTVEKQALWKCLYKEYYDPGTNSGTFVEWLKGGVKSADSGPLLKFMLPERSTTN